MPTLEQARAWYPTADPVHGFDHVERVYRTAERLAQAEGADLEIVRAAALLHDVHGSDPNDEHRADHHEQSAAAAGEILAAEGWAPERIQAVQDCIRAHRFRGGQAALTLEAQVLFDADKLDVLGAIGAARTIAYAVLAGQPHYAPPSQRFLAHGEEEPGEPHSAYHEYLFKLRRVKDRLHTASARRIAETRHAALVAFFESLTAEMEGRA
ncbi:MAG TPA: HD domain-containing protein [Anaerolineaceae bacterium]|nr:HD domain-containing protein [Anaerolineaceae bacterium]